MLTAIMCVIIMVERWRKSKLNRIDKLTERKYEKIGNNKMAMFAGDSQSMNRWGKLDSLRQETQSRRLFCIHFCLLFHIARNLSALTNLLTWQYYEKFPIYITNLFSFIWLLAAEYERKTLTQIITFCVNYIKTLLIAQTYWDAIFFVEIVILRRQHPCTLTGNRFNWLFSHTKRWRWWEITRRQTLWVWSGGNGVDNDLD